MTSSNPQLDQLFAIAQPVCNAAGYELVDVRLLMEPGGWVLRVFIDRLTSDEPVGLDDCERMSRELGAVLDVEDPIPQAYSLEVSSPGIDRPLRTAAHFRRAIGENVKVVLRRGLPVPGGENRRNFKGPVVAVNDAGTHVTVDIDGKQFELPLDDLDSARLIPDWDEVLGTHPKPGKPGKKQATKQANR